MNTKQLAEFLGKNKSNIIRHAEKIGIIFEHGKEKIFTKDECLKIAQSFYTTLPKFIKIAIDTLDISVANATDISVANATDRFDVMYKMLDELKKQDMRISRIEKIQQDTQKQLGYNGYMKLKAYCSQNKIHKNHSEMLSIARTLRVIADDEKMEIKKVQDDTYGEVNSYPIELLNLYFVGNGYFE